MGEGSARKRGNSFAKENGPESKFGDIGVPSIPRKRACVEGYDYMIWPRILLLLDMRTYLLCESRGPPILQQARRCGTAKPLCSFRDALTSQAFTTPDSCKMRTHAVAVLSKPFMNFCVWSVDSFCVGQS